MEVLLLGNAADKDDEARVYDKFEGSFLTPNTQWNYHEEACDLKQQEEETVEQHLTDQCAPQMQLPMRPNRQKLRFYLTLQNILISSTTSENP